MNHNTPTNPNARRKLLKIVSFSSLLVILFFPAQDLYADNLNACLLEALKNADNSVTVGQIREQCQQEAEKGPVPNTNMMSENTSSSMSSNGPAELVLKSPQGKKPAYFPHKIHQDKYTCGICHHGEDTSGRLDKFTAETVAYKCTTCHNPEMPNKELNSFQLIGHKLCRECHRKNQDITSARCSTCHRKNL